jgi:hypothetical protein
MAQLFLGLIAEGNTDYRFLEPIVEKALIEIAYKCKGQIDIEVRVINCDKGVSFNDLVLNASKKGNLEFGISMLIVHTDADHLSSENAYQNKFIPAKQVLEQQADTYPCL